MASAQHLDQFALVERCARNHSGALEIFLNSIANGKTDFMLSITARDWTQFQGVGIDSDANKSQRIHGRRWLKSRNCPTVNMTHPEKIEVLSP